MTMTCDKVRQMMTDQITALSETKAELHAKMLRYIPEEREMKKLALQAHQLKSQLAKYE